MHPVRYLCFFVLLNLTAVAQRVMWSDAGTGDPADLQLVFEECEPSGTPALPSL
ncbi:MAG: hypothetical protein IT582_11265, partial [Opitutaceae bacterium]|nr:hypothetical protein [Opitutaceae bacterium]